MTISKQLNALKKMKKFLKIISLFAVAGIICGLTAWLAIKHISTKSAEAKAENIIEAAYEKHQPSDDGEKIIAISKEIFENFEHLNPKHDPLLRIRGYVTNKRLPEILRLPTGVIETHIQRGLCDNASRMLAFIIEQEGFKSVQWNMTTDFMGHSALLVSTPDDQEFLADPYHGYATKDYTGNLLHPHDAQKRIKAGEPYKNVFQAFGPDSIDKLYSDFSEAVMAAEGQPVTLETTLPVLGNTPLVLGSLDGDYKDVKTAGMENNMGPYWTYMGHRYNREWTRILRVKQPVQVVMTLTEHVDEGVLITDKKPDIDGKQLTWNLYTDDQLVFNDGRAQISLSRLNSYIDVDQLTFIPLNQSLN